MGLELVGRCCVFTLRNRGLVLAGPSYFLGWFLGGQRSGQIHPQDAFHLFDGRQVLFVLRVFLVENLETPHEHLFYILLVLYLIIQV